MIDDDSPLSDLQADPQLKLSEGRASWLQVTMVAAACALILGIMIYGLNQPVREGSIIAASPGGAETTGAAPRAEQTGGNVAGGANAQKPEQAAQQPNQPTQQPVPEQVKPGTPDDSKR